MDISYIALNRIVEERIAADKKYRKEIKMNEKITLSSGSRMSDNELLEKLRSFNVVLDKKIFSELCNNFLSAEEMSNWLIKKYNLEFVGMEIDWIWICLSILWERWMPDKPSFEMIDDIMQEGYSRSAENDCTGACKIWLEVFKAILNIMDSEQMKSLNDFDNRFRGTQSMFNWVQDLEMELGNAGREDEKFFKQRILFGEEFISRFAHENSLIIENMKMAVADSYLEIGKLDRTESLFSRWLAEDPKWGWGWIGWSDCYWLTNREHKFFEKAEKILKEGISIANVRDREAILARLRSLYSETGREKDAKEIHREIMPPQNNIRDISDTNKEQLLAEHKKIKVGRNDPCPCGSGKKFKKCCGR